MLKMEMLVMVVEDDDGHADDDDDDGVDVDVIQSASRIPPSPLHASRLCYLWLGG